jgi:hypothetical protein
LRMARRKREWTRLRLGAPLHCGMMSSHRHEHS